MLDYEGLTVRDLKRIVNREEATPAAIGLFVLYDYWEREHGRRAIVDNKLLRYIESKWAYSPHANELDYWLELGAQLRILELQGVSRGHEAITSMSNGTILILQAEGAIHAGGFKMLYAQALELKIDVSQFVELITNARAMSSDWPEETEIKRVAREISSRVESFLAYLPIMRDLSTLMGISITEELELDVASIETWQKEQRDKIDYLGQLGAERPEILERLKWLTHIDMDSVSTSVLTYWASTFAAYLSPNWRAWARAGVNLREIAEGSKRVGDLIRHAELAAVEFDNE